MNLSIWPGSLQPSLVPSHTYGDPTIEFHSESCNGRGDVWIYFHSIAALRQFATTLHALADKEQALLEANPDKDAHKDKASPVTAPEEPAEDEPHVFQQGLQLEETSDNRVTDVPF